MQKAYGLQRNSPLRFTCPPASWICVAEELLANVSATHFFEFLELKQENVLLDLSGNTDHH